MSGQTGRAPMPSTRFSARKVRPAAVTVCLSTIVARALSTYSTSSCSLVCQFMNACALPRPARNSSTRSRMLARDGVELGEEQLVGEPPHPVELLGGLGEQVVRHAGLVRARAAEERPGVDDQRPAAHRLHVRRAEPAAGAAADEDRVVLAVAVVLREVEDRLGRPDRPARRRSARIHSPRLGCWSRMSIGFSSSGARRARGVRERRRLRRSGRRPRSARAMRTSSASAAAKPAPTVVDRGALLRGGAAEPVGHVADDVRGRRRRCRCGWRRSRRVDARRRARRPVEAERRAEHRDGGRVERLAGEVAAREPPSAAAARTACADHLVGAAVVEAAACSSRARRGRSPG